MHHISIMRAHICMRVRRRKDTKNTAREKMKKAKDNISSALFPLLLTNVNEFRFPPSRQFPGPQYHISHTAV